MTPPKKSFCFAPQFNSPNHEDPSKMSNDAEGAFHHGMDAFKAMYNGKGGGVVQTMKFNNHLSDAMIFDSIITAIWMGPNQLDSVAYFGHGTPKSLSSAKIGRNGLKPFAAAIRGNCNPGVKIILYACSAGRRNYEGGCFASHLARELSDMKAVVYAHDIRGHSFRNPTLYSYPLGTKVAPPGLEHGFIKAMHEKRGTLWARFPFMTQAELEAEVKSGRSN